MDMEHVFELVRKEDVILWIGSGFSMYAGYPSGKELAEIIYSRLTKTQKKLISQNSSLDFLAEEFIRIHSGSELMLIEILKEVFMKRPNSTKHHKTLSEISHIKTIVTTNYDPLIENAYGEECCKIINPIDIVYCKNKTEIFKVHGDLSDPKSVIIATRHYKNFLKDDIQNNLLWSILKGKIATKSVVSMGYNLEDLNVQIIFDKISEALSPHQKQMFFIAPNLPEHKISHLTKLNIEYINLTGEKFIEDLLANIKQNIRIDSERGYTSAETLQDFFLKNNLEIDLATSKNKFKIKSISGLDGAPIKGNVSFRFKGEKTKAELDNFLTGKDLSFELNNENVESIKFTTESGINMLSVNNENFKFIMQKRAGKQGKFDLRFIDGFEAEGLDYKAFAFQKGIKLIVSYKNCDFTIIKDFNRENDTIDFKFEIKSPFQKIEHAVNTFSILQRMKQGLSFSVFPDDNLPKLEFQQRADQNMTFPIEAHLFYYTSLKSIEKYFNIRFTDIMGFSEIDYEDVQYLNQYMKNRQIDSTMDGEYIISFIDNSNAIDFKNKIEQTAGPLKISLKEKSEFEIRGIKIALSYQSQIITDCIVTNADEIVIEKSKIVKVKSKSNKVKVIYTETPEISGTEVLVPITD